MSFICPFLRVPWTFSSFVVLSVFCRWTISVNGHGHRRHLREFQSNETLGVVFECLDHRVFEISWEYARRMRSLESWECLGIYLLEFIYPEVTKLRSWRREVEESFSVVHLIRVYVHSSFWLFDRPIECLRIPQSLCSGREINKKLTKQYVYYWLELLASWKRLIFYKC